MAPIKSKAFINVDLGEAYGNFKCGPDDDLFPLIDQANVACGFHAGDPVVMSRTVRACKKYNIATGAHPGLPDIQGFGRRELVLTPEEHTANIIYQVGALKAFLDREGMELHHVKPHGMLYGLCCRDIDIARAVMAGIPRNVPVIGLPGTHMETAAHEAGLVFWAEFFADVKYTNEGTLFIDRKKLPWSLDDVKKHVSQQIQDSSVTSVDGKVVPFDLKDYPVTICCHSDSPDCVEIVKVTREVVDQFNNTMGYD
ncbi:lactam utilization protein lamb [Penicillium sp. IBT 31633x]|nr:lactam utilization protein lamb [Penicillium sp. IBT 31633x]